MAIECVAVDDRGGKMCSVEGCEKQLRARGLCSTHWRRWSIHGDPSLGARKLATQGCSVQGCDRPHSGHGLCNLHWQRKHNGRPLANERLDRPIWGICRTIGCNSTVRSGFANFCEKHYGRVRRRGTDDDPIITRRYLSSDGYVIVSGRQGHPASGDHGRAYEHRIVLYDEIGPGWHNCYWCDRPVSWDVKKGDDKLVVDHVDGDKQNNSPSNLKPSCHACNYKRGLFLAWVGRHADDPVLEGLFQAAKQRALSASEIGQHRVQTGLQSL
ncbi:HNH endonuclease [Methylobacterium aquaticum]|uniref:HNH endonuclease n=1 Tax=Methylobacterium aquaticum TaxID=270351 RepID=UPI0009E2F21F|nr:HNH endonuclease [Methylobacterium aquaticum]